MLLLCNWAVNLICWRGRQILGRGTLHGLLWRTVNRYTTELFVVYWKVIMEKSFIALLTSPRLYCESLGIVTCVIKGQLQRGSGRKACLASLWSHFYFPSDKIAFQNYYLLILSVTFSNFIFLRWSLIENYGIMEIKDKRMISVLTEYLVHFIERRKKCFFIILVVISWLYFVSVSFLQR